MPRTLSELAAEKPEALRYYRTVLWICGPLFAVTAYAFVLPRITHPLFVGIAWTLIILPEMIIGFFPAQRCKITPHDIIAGMIGTSMIAAGYIFALCMSLLGVLCAVNRKRYLLYELSLIYISHFSILVEALALR